MNELALFAGGGGGLLATKWLLGWRTVCYVEKDPYCQALIQTRINDGWLDDAPIWDDARSFDGRAWHGAVDIVTAGFPCQPFSAAGKRAGENDDRNLWPDTLRIIGEVKPEWVLLENVSRLLAYPYIQRIYGELAACGFDVAWDCIPAEAVGANHLRDRWFAVAHHHGFPIRKQYRHAEAGPDHEGDVVGGASHAQYKGRTLRRKHSAKQTQAPEIANGHNQRYAAPKFSLVLERQGGARVWANPDGSHWWNSKPPVQRVDDGMAGGLDRQRAIGNGQVPQVVALAWHYLSGRLMER